MNSFITTHCVTGKREVVLTDDYILFYSRNIKHFPFSYTVFSTRVEIGKMDTLDVHVSLLSFDMCLFKISFLSNMHSCRRCYLMRSRTLENVSRD